MEQHKWQKRDAEYLRTKKLKSLNVVDTKCVKITDMFTAVASASSVGEDSSSRQGEQQPEMQACERETEGQTEQESVVRKQELRHHGSRNSKAKRNIEDKRATKTKAHRALVAQCGPYPPRNREMRASSLGT
ncbi:uncharacterized protein LOC143509892 [Brachyhypopomus gauderio]|uniref:uncharacterized protein LOC143509892 n=1 Tax=Brachyhypopomus gauderio TaxID=698409 RepID=UPI0040435BC7